MEATTAESPSLEDEVTDAGLTMDDWDDFYDVMTDEYESENVKENYNCWMLNYLTGCSLCTPCRGPDPFD